MSIFFFQKYLLDNLYGTVTTDDLWQAMTEVGHCRLTLT